MPQPLYKDAACKKPDAGFHKGLWFERFFNYTDLSTCKVEVDDKTSAIQGVSGEAGNNDQLTRFTERQIKLVNHLGGQFQIFSLDWHFVTGMGNEHPVENGFLWHPVLGTPYLQGSSIKGLLRSWLEQNEVSGEILHQWFGSDAKKPEHQDKENQAGGLIFHDAIPVKSPTVTADIMTPHMGKWYEKGGQNNPANQPETVPADWHNPVPVPFLVTKDAAFLFAVSPRAQEMAGQMDQVMEELDNALEWLGAGAKTSVGYGSMSRDENQEQLFSQRIQVQEEQQQQQAFEASLSPAQLMLHQLRQQLEREKNNKTIEPGGTCKKELNDLVKNTSEQQWLKEDLETLETLARDILNHHGPKPNKKGKGKELMQKIRILLENAQ